MILAYSRSGFLYFSLIMAVGAAILSLCLAPMAHGEVNSQDVFSFLSHPVTAPPGMIDFANDVAAKQVLQQLVRKPGGSFDDHFARRLGFDLYPPNQAEEAVQHASTLLPIAIFTVSLKSLQQYDAGADPLKLLGSDSNWLLILTNHTSTIFAPARFLFPIAVPDPNGEKVVQSSVRLLGRLFPIASIPPKLAFEINGYGSSPLIRKIDKWRRDPHTTGAIVPDYFHVWVPALDRFYLGRLRGKDLLIKAITDDFRVGLKEGQENVAKEVFLKLRTEALTIDANDSDAPPR
jgi:hypothetical protein